MAEVHGDLILREWLFAASAIFGLFNDEAAGRGFGSRQGQG